MGSIGNSNGSLQVDADIIIVGGGFSGIYALYKARELGLSVKLIEAGSDYGGTWYWVCVERVELLWGKEMLTTSESISGGQS